MNEEKNDGINEQEDGEIKEEILPEVKEGSENNSESIVDNDNHIGENAGNNNNGVYPDEGKQSYNGGYSGNYYGGNYNGGYGGNYFGQQGTGFPQNGGYNYGYNGYGGYQNKPDTEEPKKKKNKNSLIPLIAVFAVICILFSSLFYMLGRYLSYSESNVSGGEKNNSQTEDKGNTESGDQKDNEEYLQNGDFELEQVPAEEHYKLASVYSMTKDSVVEITTESVTTGSFMQQYVTTGAGSGVIITGDGYIVTNHHVIEGAYNIRVTLADGRSYEATLVGTDAKTDVAVLKIDETGLKNVTMGVSGDLLVGEDVLIIGNPLGSLGGSATNGIVSATARMISVQGQVMTLIQTNAAVNPGNSGGAMFNMAGQLIGIVNAKYTDEEIEGIGFAIPIDTAKPIIEDLTNYGYVKGRTNIGLTVQYGTLISDLGNRIWVTGVADGSDAAKAGIKMRDEIASVNGQTFTNAQSLNIYLDSLKIGDEITVKINRYTQRSISFFQYEIEKEEFSYTFTLTEYTK